MSLVATQIPFQVNKSALLEKIADLVKEGKVQGISDLRDESDRDGMRIVIELKKDANPKVVLNQLFVHSPLQMTFGAIMLGLVDNRPQVLTLRALLDQYVVHRQIVVRRRTEFELAEAEAFLNLVRTASMLDCQFARLFREKKLSPCTYNVLRILRGAGDIVVCGTRLGQCRYHRGDRRSARLPVLAPVDRRHRHTHAAPSHEQPERREAVDRVERGDAGAFVIGDTLLDDRSVEVLTAHWDGLVELKLDNNRLSRVAARHLLAAPVPPGLTALSLRGNRFSDGLMQQLWRHFGERVIL